MTQRSIHFESLEGIPEETLYAAFIDAFSDYEVPVTASLEDFLSMHRRRGVSYAASVGAFDAGADGRLVAFIFNGDGDWMGSRCAYDAGTGVALSHRGLGLSKSLAAEAAARLREAGFRLWFLEVLVGNEKAIRTYKGAGFRPTRRFSCPDGCLPEARRLAPELASAAGVEVRDLGHLDTGRFASWRSWPPSWQNSDVSVRRSPERLVALGAFGPSPGEGPLGYVVATDRGSVFQLAVRPDSRRRGVGRALAAALAARVPDGRIRYVNVQSDDRATLGLLSSLGLSSLHDQWEMLLEL